LKGAIRESDELARLGGDEFAVLAHTSTDGAAVIRENIANILVTPVVAGGMSIDVGLSVGIALFPQDGSTPDALLAAADRDMYQMKSLRKRAHLRSIS
jgi:diguanylate cyclase (GGDEF)-like protein